MSTRTITASRRSRAARPCRRWPTERYPNYWSTLEMAPVFGFIGATREYFDFARTRPNRFIALARDFRVDPASKATPAPEASRYSRDRFLAPAVGAYSAIVRSGLTLSTIHRASLERQLSGVRVLVLANAGAAERPASRGRFASSCGGRRPDRHPRDVALRRERIAPRRFRPGRPVRRPLSSPCNQPPSEPFASPRAEPSVDGRLWAAPTWCTTSRSVSVVPTGRGACLV